MSYTKNINKFNIKNKIDVDNKPQGNEVKVTVSKKPSTTNDGAGFCSGQRSFISIHSTDQPCLADVDTASNLDDCNVEVLSLNEVFPSTSEESLSNDDSPVRRKKNAKNKTVQNVQPDDAAKSTYVPTNSKSSTGSRPKETPERQASVYSDYDLPKNTLHVIGSNPGEPKMSYTDPPKKLSKTMKKFLRNMDKHKCDQYMKSSEKAVSKLTTMRGILKDGRCGPECTGDSSVQGVEEFNDEATLQYQVEYDPRTNYTKQNPDKNVTFNTQVMIIHFTGDLCVGQSVEALSKEKDQQARNSELRKTFLTKYNEFWPTKK
ncbi:uncharacterized protein LOC101738357 isoform X2 [Bombyx mori]|uniref:Uncharacterized protein n=1 Tax=Bombyx mori TaxID=7091 RepID=A0A8R2HPZ4_BOMMO|nr:uncharacterized protein LOC101738357 isoform X2 [Bombyx mori]